ncbi:MAG TPA: cell division protein SepF [Chthonomonadales bacterium]|nr:cell division protein SepF [Chthonomonadales bacterium]
MNAEPLPDDFERKGWWSRISHHLFPSDEPEEEEELDAGAAAQASAQNAQRQHSLRLQSARGSRVAIRLNAQVFEDAKLAADGLKSGEHQIVNLERATPQMGERIIDFLNGVCYALDGTVERIGERVYMFVPANVTVEVDSGATAAASARTPAYGQARE